MSKKRTSSPHMARNIVSYIFAFILSLVLLALTALVLLRFGVFSKGSFLSILDEQYYESCLKNIEDQAYYYTLPTGIDPSVLEGAFLLDEVKQDVDQYVIEAFNGSEYVPDLSGAKERLSDNAAAFFTDSGAAITGETEEIIASYVQDIADIYETYAKMPGLNLIVQAKDFITRYSLIGIGALAAVSLILLIILIKLHHFLHRSLRYLAYTFGGTALMTFAAPFYLYMSRAYLGLNLEPEYFYLFGTALVRHLLMLCFLAAGCWFILMIITIILIGILRHRAIHPKKHKKKSYHKK